MPLKTLPKSKYVCFIHVPIFSDNTEVDFKNHFNVVFSVPNDILNKHGLEHITFLTKNGLDNKIECGLLCIFNDECDFFMYPTSSSSCYLASYNTTGRGLSGNWTDSSEVGCYQNLEEMGFLIQKYDVAYGLISNDIKDWTKWIYKSDSKSDYNFYR